MNPYNDPKTGDPLAPFSPFPGGKGQDEGSLAVVIPMFNEETAVLQVPSLQMRKATERPQVYDCQSSVKFDPDKPAQYPADKVWQKLEHLHGRTWEHKLGDGKASGRIVADLVQRLRTDGFRLHKPEHYHLPIARSYREDGLCESASPQHPEAA